MVLADEGTLANIILFQARRCCDVDQWCVIQTMVCEIVVIKQGRITFVFHEEKVRNAVGVSVVTEPSQIRKVQPGICDLARAVDTQQSAIGATHPEFVLTGIVGAAIDIPIAKYPTYHSAVSQVKAIEISSLVAVEVLAVVGQAFDVVAA